MKNKIYLKKIVQNENFLMLIVGILLTLLVFFVVFPRNSVSSVGVSNTALKVPSFDAKLIVGCENCFDLNPILEEFKKSGKMDIRSVEEFDYKSSEAKDLIKKYGITKIPVMILKSENFDASSFSSGIFKVKEDALIFDKAVPSFDLGSGKISGILDMVEIQDSSCVECASFSFVQDKFKEFGIKIGNYKIIDSSSDEGKRLIEENDISIYPSLLVGKNIKDYWWVFSSLKPELLEKEKYYLLTSSVYPSKNVSTGEIYGKVDATYLSDKNCEDCFNISLLSDMFKQSGIYLEKEETFDISSPKGKSLISKYNITEVPTIIFSKEFLDYKGMKPLINKTGSIEEDNSFVFRNFEGLGFKTRRLE